MTLRTEPQPIPRRALASAEPYGGTGQILGPVRRLFRERPILWDFVLALGGFAVAAMPTAYAAQTQLHAALRAWFWASAARTSSGSTTTGTPARSARLKPTNRVPSMNATTRICG